MKVSKMNSFIESSLRNFCSTHEIFGESSVYEHFERKPESNENRYGMNSAIMFGHIVYRTVNDEVKASGPLMLKSIIPKGGCVDYILVQYYNEIFFYTRALPLLQQFGSLETMLPKFHDSCIHANQSSTNIILIYENLKARGFCDHGIFSFLDLEHLTLMVRKLGQFHSYSYLAKSRNPKEFNGLGKWFKYAEAELIRIKPNYFHLFAGIGVQRLRQDPRYSSHIGRVEKVQQNAAALVLQLNTTEQAEPMSVLCHGDYVRGNVMFRYENGRPVDMKLIDMGTCRVASPVVDLSLVLYLHADQQTRSRHWNHLVDCYYEGLCQECGGVGVPSKQSILKEFTTKAVYGYLIAAHFLPTLIRMDRSERVCNFLHHIPAEYDGHCTLGEIPESVFEDCINRWCSVEDPIAEPLANILRDLIDRRFI